MIMPFLSSDTPPLATGLFIYGIPEHRKWLIGNSSFFETMERKDPCTPLIIFG